MKRRKQVTMTVTVSVPMWLTAAQARREVRALINDQAFWGHYNPTDSSNVMDFEIGDHNFRAVKIGPSR